MSVVVFSTCERVENDVKKYYPEVKTVSATLLSDGSVLVIGSVISDGTTPVEVAGFCAGTSDLPTMSEKQAIATFFSTDSFYVVYDGFDRNKRYYFRSWAGNETGYSYGNAMYIDNITPTFVNVPCNSSLNTVDFGTGAGAVKYSEIGVPSSLNSSFNATWFFEAKTFSGGKVSFTFGSKPATGKFTITDQESPDENEVFVSINTGYSEANLNRGAFLYINEEVSGILTITICHAPWGPTGGNSLTTKFSCAKTNNQ